MYLVMCKEDYDVLVSSKDSATSQANIYAGLFSDRKKVRAYCRKTIADDLAHDLEPSKFVILDINEFLSCIVTGKPGVTLSNQELE